MADADTIRLREIRKRKILEQSEARLSRITSAKKNEVVDKTEKEDISLSRRDVSNNSLQFPQRTLKNVNIDSVSSAENHGFDQAENRIIDDDEDSYNVSSNGSVQKSPAVDNYIFPKKVSDAETRSFVRSRCDARRNSTCTQMMMETFQFTTFSLALLRPWITAVFSIVVSGYFLFIGNLPFLQTLLLPYFLLEIAFWTWSKFEMQANSRQNTSSVMGVLALCGIPLHIVTKINSLLYLVQSAVQDLAVYMFLFVFLHFICETYL